MECNIGSVHDIGLAESLFSDDDFVKSFKRLGKSARICQDQEMVPLVLLQMPWRGEEGGGLEENSGTSSSSTCTNYFEHGIKGFAQGLERNGVDPTKILLKTRPPLGISEEEEK